MRINPIQSTMNMKRNSISKKLKSGLWFTGMVLTELGIAAKDMFKREKKYYVEIDGKLIDERDLPQSISNHYDRITMKWGKAVYYPEDIEKMKNMTGCVITGLMHPAKC